VFSPDGRWLLLRRSDNEDPRLFLVRCGSWKVAGEWPSPRSTTPVFSPDGRFLFVRGLAGTFKAADSTRQNYLFLEINSEQPRMLLLDSSMKAIRVARFSPDSRWLAVATQDREVRLLEPQSGKKVTSIPTEMSANAIAFNRSSQYLGVASSSVAVKIFELRTGAEVSRVGLDERERVLALRFSEDNRSVIFASSITGSEEGTDEGDVAQASFLRRRYLFAEDLIPQACARVSRNLSLQQWKTYLPEEQYQKTCPDLPEGVLQTK